MALLYQDLVELARTFTDDQQQYTNRRSSLAGRSGFLNFLGLTLESPIGNEFFDQPSIDAWLKDKPAPTARASQTHLRWWQTTHTKLLRAQGLPDDPSERIQVAMKQGMQELGINVTQLALKAGLQRQMLGRWVNGSQLPSNRQHVARLEEVLSLPAGTLTSHIWRERRGESFCPQKRLPRELRGRSWSAVRLRARLRWRLPLDFPSLDAQEQDRLIATHAAAILNDPVYVHRSIARAHQYGLRLDDAPEQLRVEIDIFFTYKMAPILPTHQRRHTRGHIRRETSRRSWEVFFEMFFGWYLLSSVEQYRKQHGRQPKSKMLLGAGGKPEELTLGLLSIPALVEAYLVWRTTVRSSSPNNGTVATIQKIKSLVHPETGYLTQHPELIETVPERYREMYYRAHTEFLQAAAAEQNALGRALRDAETRLKRRKVL